MIVETGFGMNDVDELLGGSKVSDVASDTDQILQ
jgi:hypothetical protein